MPVNIYARIEAKSYLCELLRCNELKKSIFFINFL